MITIHICLDCELLCIAQGLLTILQPMLNRAHYAFTTQTRGNSRKHLLSLAVLALGRFVLNLMCVSFELDEKIAKHLTLPGADTDMTPVILSGPSYWRFSSNWKRPSSPTFCGGALGLVCIPGMREKLFCM